MFDCTFVWVYYDSYLSVLAICVGAICLFFIVPLGILICVQTRNIMTNTTTNERYSGRNYDELGEETESNEFVQRGGLAENCVNVCCGDSFECKVDVDMSRRSGSSSSDLKRYNPICEPLLR